MVLGEGVAPASSRGRPLQPTPLAMAESGLYRGRAETNEPGHPAVLVGPALQFCTDRGRAVGVVLEFHRRYGAVRRCKCIRCLSPPIHRASGISTQSVRSGDNNRGGSCMQAEYLTVKVGNRLAGHTWARAVINLKNPKVLRARPGCSAVADLGRLVDSRAQAQFREEPQHTHSNRSPSCPAPCAPSLFSKRSSELMTYRYPLRLARWQWACGNPSHITCRNVVRY